MFLTQGRPVETFAAPRRSWGQAVNDLAEAHTNYTDLVSNTLYADQLAQQEVFDRQIADIHRRTGVQLDNPLREAVQVVDDRQRALFGGRTYPDADPSALAGLNIRTVERETIAQFDARLAELRQKFPDQADAFSPDRRLSVREVRRQADAAYQEQLSSDELGFAGKLAAIFKGEGIATLKDPVRLGVLFAGAAPSAARTVAARIGQTMLREALINAGAEIPLQAAEQARRRDAGLSYGLSDAAGNVALAGTFGAAFGGAFQGGAEVLRALRPAVDSAVDVEQPIAEAIDRIVEGQPQAGDVEAVADHIGVDLSPDNRGLLQRSFEDQVLDEQMVPADLADASPERLVIAEAAMRHAEDPDNFPPPEELERQLADRRADRLFDDERYDEPVPTGENRPFDPLDGMSLAPRVADEVAGEVPAASPDLPDAEFDAPDQPKDYRDVIAVEDRDGNLVYRSPKAAYDMAGEDDLLADILEACKL